jgi:phage I-like protein
MTKLRTFQRILLSEDSQISNRVQLFRTGEFHHEEYGKFSITPKMLNEMKQNFDAKVRGIDIAIDYRHDSEDIAAGWITALELTEDGSELWAQVTWTPKGSKVLSEKEFRYLSPEFTNQYQDAETLKKFGPVLMGAGLTNRPFIKSMEPVVELSEIQSKENKTMDMTPEEMKAKMDELMAENAQLKEQLSQMQGEKDLADKAQAVACEEKKMAEKKIEFLKLLSEGKVCSAQEESFVKGDMAKFVELSQPVKLSDKGTSSGTPNTVSHADPEEEVLALAEKQLSDKAAKTLSEAISNVLKDRKDLREKLYS